LTAAARAPGWALAALLLMLCAAGGFLLHRLTVGHARATLYAAPAAAVVPQPPGAPQPTRPIPEQLPDIALPGLDGAMHHLTDWKGRALVINFWATWCEPCRREVPLLKSLRRERSAQRLEVIGVAVDAPAAVRTYAARNGMNYPLLIGEQGGLEAAQAFGMDTVLPFSVFADRAGEIVALKIGELHRDEAVYILDRVQDVDAGRLGLEAAQKDIAEAVDRMGAARRAKAAE
jgi:peroxiredoxin